MGESRRRRRRRQTKKLYEKFTRAGEVGGSRTGRIARARTSAAVLPVGRSVRFGVFCESLYDSKKKKKRWQRWWNEGGQLLVEHAQHHHTLVSLFFYFYPSPVFRAAFCSSIPFVCLYKNGQRWVKLCRVYSVQSWSAATTTTANDAGDGQANGNSGQYNKSTAQVKKLRVGRESLVCARVPNPPDQRSYSSTDISTTATHSTTTFFGCCWWSSRNEFTCFLFLPVHHRLVVQRHSARWLIRLLQQTDIAFLIQKSYCPY